MTHKQNPYQVIKRRHITEKATMLQNLKNSTSNVSVRRCSSPKYVFIVDRNANKHQIASAVEEIYASQNIRVVDVNTIQVKGKNRRVRGREGVTNPFKKAIVTVRPGDSLDHQS